MIIWGGEIMIYFISVLLVVSVLLYAMPIFVSLEVKRVKENDSIVIGVKTCYGLVKFNTEIPFLEIVFKDGKPALKYKLEVADRKRSKLFARFTKLLSAEEGGRLYDILKGKKHSIISALRYISGKIIVRDFNLRLTLGTGDAAETGILYGAAWILIGNIMALTASHINIKEPRIAVIPVFNRVQLNIHFSCIITMRLGHIINTGIRVIPALLSSKRK